MTKFPRTNENEKITKIDAAEINIKMMPGEEKMDINHLLHSAWEVKDALQGVCHILVKI